MPFFKQFTNTQFYRRHLATDWPIASSLKFEQIDNGFIKKLLMKTPVIPKIGIKLGEDYRAINNLFVVKNINSNNCPIPVTQLSCENSATLFVVDNATLRAWQEVMQLDVKKVLKNASILPFAHNTITEISLKSKSYFFTSVLEGCTLLYDIHNFKAYHINKTNYNSDGKIDHFGTKVIIDKILKEAKHKNFICFSPHENGFSKTINQLNYRINNYQRLANVVGLKENNEKRCFYTQLFDIDKMTGEIIFLRTSCMPWQIESEGI